MVDGTELPESAHRDDAEGFELMLGGAVPLMAHPNFHNEEIS
jgi:hypothetical protein